MPTPTETIFSLLNQFKYAEILTLIKAEPDLVNAISPEDGNSLLQSLLGVKTTEQSLALTQYVVTHPKFNFGHFNEDVETTNQDDLISMVRFDLFKLVIANPNVLFNRDKLTYESAKEYSVLIEAAIKRDLQKDPNFNVSPMSKRRSADIKEIIAYLRDAIVLHAIKTDDPSLFDRLVKAGDDPKNSLKKLTPNGDYPIQLLTNANTKLKEWFKASREKRHASSVNNPHSLYGRVKANEQIENALANCKQQYLTNIIGAKQRFLASSLNTIEGTIAAASAAVPPGNGSSR